MTEEMQEQVASLLQDSEKRYVEYVSSQIENVDKIGRLIDENTESISPEAINTALSLYYSTSLSILAEYQRQKIAYETEKLEYDIWYSERYEEAKRSVLSDYAETKIKPAVKEYDARVVTMNPYLYTEKNRSLQLAESRMRFMLHVREVLASYDKILTTISSNMRQEMVSLSIDRRMNSTEYGVRKNTVRTRFPTARVRAEIEQGEDI